MEVDVAVERVAKEAKALVIEEEMVIIRVANNYEVEEMKVNVWQEWLKRSRP